MLRAGVDGLAEGARDGGHPTPRALAVTVLTSEADASAIGKRLALAQAAGCDGVVCAASEAGEARGAPTRADGPRDPARGQRAERPGPRRHAPRRDPAGAEWIIVGRSVTAADDPPRAAARLTAEVDAALHDTSPSRGRGC